MPQIELTPAERREQRAQAHHLDPVVHIGADGLTDGVRKEVDAALNAHGPCPQHRQSFAPVRRSMAART